uniref:Uncharacterized protein n=1 Tax=Rhizophora mucronata TaxID=61149 RepID=A0A2P2NCD8_RHIMU
MRCPFFVVHTFSILVLNLVNPNLAALSS